MEKCPECGSKKIDLVRNESTCGKCGLVLEEGIFSGSRVV